MQRALTETEAAHERAVKEMFAGIASRYDLLNHVLSLNIDRTWRRKVRRKLGDVLSFSTSHAAPAILLSNSNAVRRRGSSARTSAGLCSRSPTKNRQAKPSEYRLWKPMQCGSGSGPARHARATGVG